MGLHRKAIKSRIFFLKVTQQQLIKVPFENFSASFTIVDVLQLLKTFFFNSVTSVGDSMEILYALQKVKKWPYFSVHLTGFWAKKMELWKLCCIEGKPQNWVVHTDLEISFNLWLLESTFSIRNSKVKLRLDDKSCWWFLGLSRWH